MAMDLSIMYLFPKKMSAKSSRWVVVHKKVKNSILNFSTFNDANHYQESQDEPIKEDTILTISAQNGNVLDTTGGGG